MDYNEALTRVRRIDEWTKKAAVLRLKYEKEKVACVKKINRSYDKRNYEDLQAALAELQGIILRKQMPLYNNMINFSQHVLLSSLVELKNALPEQSRNLDAVLFMCKNIFLDEFEKIRQVLARQAAFFQENDVKTTQGFFAVLDHLDALLAEEGQVFETVKKDVKKLVATGKHTEAEVKKRAGQDGSIIRAYKRYRTQASLRKLENNTSLQVSLSCAVLTCMAVGAFFGISPWWGFSIAWLYKVAFRWAPAISRGDYSEAIADFA